MTVCENIGCLALKNGNNIKHYMIKMKADIKLCASSFSVVTLPVFFRNAFLYWTRWRSWDLPRKTVFL